LLKDFLAAPVFFLPKETLFAFPADFAFAMCKI
jgi:hypothetical protein